MVGLAFWLVWCGVLDGGLGFMVESHAHIYDYGFIISGSAQPKVTTHNMESKASFDLITLQISDHAIHSTSTHREAVMVNVMVLSMSSERQRKQKISTQSNLPSQQNSVLNPLCLNLYVALGRKEES